ncbi:hypothetical protein [Rugosimonospora africana]|uniref:Uncharacterized protein n=1 Tax=Rugosimonospora africana TaxID=556532 RepID=A0A8J3VNW4_9ACTN|nr:hypothetical protein [Rugosimonospora africana]GIH13450.1 hypothetical protein Raf01_16220 [Rugosimonospora africana]
MLPAGDLKEFVGDFIRNALAAAELGRWEVLGQTVREWKATAAVYADSALLKELTKPVTDDHGPVPPHADIGE